MQIFCACLKKETRLQVFFASVLLLCGIFLTLKFFPQNSIFAAAGICLTGFGVYALLPLLSQLKSKNNPLLKIINTEPRRIVWVYGLNTERHPFGLNFMQSGVLYFKLDDGDDFSVSVPAKKLKLVSAFLNRVLPHAVFGYSAEKERRYAESPADFGKMI